MITGNKRFRKCVFCSVFLSYSCLSVNLFAQKAERVSWSIPNDSTLVLFYSRAVLPPAPEKCSLAWFTGEDKRPRRIEQSLDQKQIILIYSSKFPAGEDSFFMINEVRDKSTQAYLPLDYLTVRYTPSVYASPYRYGDIAITELMFRPSSTSTLLPNAEYIELFNSTSQAISLRGWRFVRGSTPFAIPDYLLPAGAYVVLLSRTKASLFPSTVRVLPIDGFPVLRNERDTLALYDPSNRPIAAVEYHGSWMQEALDGTSIEVIDATDFSDSPSNWLPSCAPAGGTPGCENSVWGRINPYESPYVKEVYYPSDQQLHLVFSCSMNFDSLVTKKYYCFSDPLISVVSVLPVLPMCREVTITLSDPLSSARPCRMTFKSLYSRSGQPLPLSEQGIQLSLPQLPEKGDVLLTEVLNDPPVTDADYLELYNLSSHSLDLSQLYLFSNPASGKPPIPVPITSNRRAFPPHSYLLVCKRPREIIQHYAPIDTTVFLTMSKMPTLYNDGGDIFLTTLTDTLDTFVFGKGLHSPLLRDVKGVALERVSLFVPSFRSGNWRSASAMANYGTPGYRNSAADSNTCVSDSPFEFPQQTLSPNNDGRDDCFPIRYRFSENTLFSIEIFTRSGIRLSSLVDRQLLIGEGEFVWDGRDDQGRVQPVGAYLFLLSGQTASGRLIHERKVVVLTLR